MKLTQKALKRLQNHGNLPPFELTPSLASGPDDNGEIRCLCCLALIYDGDPCFVSRQKYISLGFCLTCYIDNRNVMDDWRLERTE
jgi:hypothetical protein